MTMLAFATEFPVQTSNTSERFVAVVREWLLGSPHTLLGTSDVEGFGRLGHWSATKGNEALVSLRGARDSVDAASVRYRRLDDGLEWTTTVTFSRGDVDAWVAVRVFCESHHPATRLPPAKKPVVVRTLIDALGGGPDSSFCVEQRAYRLSNTEIDRAVTIIQGRSTNRLPIVYVSCMFRGGYVLDPDRLANDLSGMAHVVVEPNRAFSLRLQIDANSENVFGGGIGIYWPDGGGRRSFFMGRGYDGPAELAKAVREEVRGALVNRRPLERCTWAAVQEVVSRAALDELKAAGSTEVEKYIETFDREISSKNELLADAEREIARLKVEVRIYEARIPSGSGTTLNMGGEQDLYPDEISGMVVDALADYLTRVRGDSRRSHVLAALVNANPNKSPAVAYRETLKEHLRGASGLDQKARRALEQLGFEVSDNGKHYKLVFQGDDRYTFSLPKTGSDYRGGLNAAGDISRLLF
ncbi:hypothetical protein [Noviluteimonas gilva]|uniref:Uncharacterized protein n=1 Tax=Noviluteimonas gilva TaxID=2682097 RepID=A0A7C9HNJ9_9GAMM|nr:hypothetical protein [Lysobacter gilvus]MUV15192.1 hypothetical protein [Lysobacter gilvus]